jgi:hypothetical protein
VIDNYTVYALPDGPTFGENPNSAPVCGVGNDECVLYLGPAPNDFSKPHLFSAPFSVLANGDDGGENPGDGSAQTAQAITFTSTPPSPAVVGGTYTPTATGGGSGNPVVFSIGASSTSGACSVSGTAVDLTGTGTCVVDANQAGNSQYEAAAQASQSFSITTAGPGFTSADHASATVATPFTFSVTTQGTPAPKIKEKGKLPKGVKFNKSLDQLGGTPTSTKHKSAAGTFPVTFTATFGKGKAKVVVTQAFTLTVAS